MAINQPLPGFQMGNMEEQRATKQMATGLGIEALGAIAVVVLMILGLVGILPVAFAAISLIVLGVAHFFEAGSIASNMRLVSNETVATRSQESELTGGLTLSMICAIAVVALGILALVGIDRAVLIPAGVIVAGALGIFASGEKERAAYFLPFNVPVNVDENKEQKLFRASQAGVGLQVLTGIGAIVLGILALVGKDPLLMVLVGLLAVSAGIFLSSAALTSKMSTLLGR